MNITDKHEKTLQLSSFVNDKRTGFSNKTLGTNRGWRSPDEKSNAEYSTVVLLLTVGYEETI